MEYTFIKEAFIPETIGRRGKYAGIINDWSKTDNRTLKLVCSSPEEKKKIYGSVSAYKKAHNLDFTVYLEKGTYNIYLVKA